MLTGAPLAEFLSSIRAKQRTQPMGEGTEYNVYPPSLHDPYRARRFKCGEDLYATLNIPREDKPARIRHFARNYELFGAPVALFFSLDRRMGQDQWADVGMFMQNIMLLARHHGLHTCAQEAWAVWYKSVAEFLQLPVSVDPADYMLPEAGLDLDNTVARFEYTLIQRALDRTSGNKRQAADLLKVKRTTLIEKLKRLERS